MKLKIFIIFFILILLLTSFFVINYLKNKNSVVEFYQVAFDKYFSMPHYDDIEYFFIDYDNLIDFNKKTKITKEQKEKLKEYFSKNIKVKEYTNEYYIEKSAIITVTLNIENSKEININITEMFDGLEKMYVYKLYRKNYIWNISELSNIFIS